MVEMTEVREATLADIPQILELQRAAYPVLSQYSAWQHHHLAHHQARFGPGQLVAVREQRIVGYAACFVAKSLDVLKPHTFRDVTVRGTFDGHDPTGDALYGAEIMVHPDARRRGIGRRLYKARFDLVRRLGLRFFVAGGRVPGFSEVTDHVTIERYVDDVVAGRRADRVLTHQLQAGLRVAGILPEYLNDPKSRNYAVLLVWENPDLGVRPVPQRAKEKTLGPRHALA